MIYIEYDKITTNRDFNKLQLQASFNLSHLMYVTNPLEFQSAFI